MNDKFSLSLISVAVALVLGLSACSKQEATTAATAAAPAQGKRAPSLDIVAAEAKGFTVGAVMSARTAYVFFDPQCPHCGHLWQAAEPLLGKYKFVWIPVAFLSPKSAPQGAALLTAANPVQAMTEHEKSLLDRQGGISASADAPKELLEAIRKNTLLLNEFGVESVPYVVTKNASTGQLDARNGTMDTAGLAAFLGISPP